MYGYLDGGGRYSNYIYLGYRGNTVTRRRLHTIKQRQTEILWFKAKLIHSVIKRALLPEGYYRDRAFILLVLREKMAFGLRLSPQHTLPLTPRKARWQLPWGKVRWGVCGAI